MTDKQILKILTTMHEWFGDLADLLGDYVDPEKLDSNDFVNTEEWEQMRETLKKMKK